jgi:hypothetical protein
LFWILVDTKNRNIAQVDATLGLKFVEGVIPGEKVKRKTATEKSGRKK